MKETKGAIESVKESARQIAKIDEQEFQLKMKELEAEFSAEVYELRENLKRKADQLRTAKYKADFEVKIKSTVCDNFPIMRTTFF